jgi:hypothetical protein
VNWRQIQSEATLLEILCVLYMERISVSKQTAESILIKWSPNRQFAPVINRNRVDF